MEVKQSFIHRKQIKSASVFYGGVCSCSCMLSILELCHVISDNSTIWWVIISLLVSIISLVIIALVNAKIRIYKEGIGIYVCGHWKLREYRWKDIVFAGPILVEGDSRTPTQMYIVCSTNLPYLRYPESKAYTFSKSGAVYIDDIPENRRLLDLYFKEML